MKTMKFLDNVGTFELTDAGNHSGLYFPIASETGLKSAIAPDLNGDAKLDQNHFLLEPTSVENLQNNRSGRNFWCKVNGKDLYSVVGADAKSRATAFTGDGEKTTVKAGFMWHEVTRKIANGTIDASVTSFMPKDKNVEIHLVSLTNTSNEHVDLKFFTAIPIYGRSADNLRDHRHVTSLLHRTQVKAAGVVVTPTLSFDERGHQLNDTTYFVNGLGQGGLVPVCFYPVLDDFIGEGGNLEAPLSLINNEPGCKAGFTVNGQESIGAFGFEDTKLAPGETVKYAAFAGTCQINENPEDILSQYKDICDVEKSLEETKKYWADRVNVSYHTKDGDFDNFMQWVSFQPELRRIYGCSFLPHHDYGKGGRGWRDLWQDCLALLLMNPAEVRELLLSNFEGVRMDGTNATIIGSKPGEFKADRNGITRVWMDHGVWPFMTTLLYMNQTGDFELLLEKRPYFKDRQVKRGKAVDETWEVSVNRQSTTDGEVYEGSVLEHLLLQNLTSFWEVGEHNHILLRDADWNDALDMAGKRGESVAFTNAYGKNLLDLADALEILGNRGVREVELWEGLEKLLVNCDNTYYDITAKTQILNDYLESCVSVISNKKCKWSVEKLADNLRSKGQWILNNVRNTEWVEDGENGWFNGYYDNDGEALEGCKDGKADMMLTSQVFSIMSGTATKDQVAKICRSADKYLYDENCGGYRLNTDFNQVKTNMGRMFGFAYGEKENGAVFSHMSVMYANALYRRGFAKEAYKSLGTLYKQSMDLEKSHIYPGIPEYFGRGGRGLYHYLTGSASWYMLTVITEMFGVKGNIGELTFEPKLLADQFDEDGVASIKLFFKGEPIEVIYHNPDHLEFGSYRITSVTSDNGRYEITLGE